MGIVDVVNRSPVTHKVIKALRLRPLANALLERVPIVRRLPKTGVRYRLKYIDSITLAEEIFGAARVYDEAVPPDLETFVDLGCNVGQFVAFLAERTGRRDLMGLAIDADPEMIAETSWVVRDNRLDGVHPVLGLIGSGAPGSEGDFFLHPVRVKSSRFAVPEPGQPDKGEFTRIRVPYLDLDALWRGILGDRRCDLLKIDIEGGESELVRPDNPFFARVDRIVVECHKWVVAPEEIVARLAAMGFEKKKTLHETDGLAVITFARKGL